MVVICLGPVCVPLWGLLPVLFALWSRFKDQMLAWWSPPAAAPTTNEKDRNEDGKVEDEKIQEWSESTAEVRVLKSVEEWRELRASGKTLVVDFTATWCGPCKEISPFYEQLCKETNSSSNKAMFVKVDVDDLDEVAAECGVGMMPTFIVYQNGNKVSEVTGARQESLAEMIRTHC